MTNQEIRERAVRWIDGEIARLRAERAAIMPPRRKMTPAREKKVKAKIIAGRRKHTTHWTQKPENRDKVTRAVRLMQRGKDVAA